MRLKKGLNRVGNLPGDMPPGCCLRFSDRTLLFSKLSVFAPEHQKSLETLLADIPPEVLTASDSPGWIYISSGSMFQAVVAIGGAVVGGIIGGMAEEGATQQQGMEYIIETENGPLITVIQRIEPC